MKSATPMDPKNPSLNLEAGEWLLNLEDCEPHEEHPYPDPARRQEAFLQWVTRSPEHLKAFLETAETWKRLARIDSKRLIQIQELLEDRAAEVIHLYEPLKRTENVNAARNELIQPKRPGVHRRAWAVAATITAVAVIVAWIGRENFGSHRYQTAVGEQRSWQLEDGSVVYLNADSRIEVDFSRHRRQIRLMQGEALFTAARDAQRPFIVNAGDAVIQAVGTQFNVRQRAHGTDVVVVEGAVQVAAARVPAQVNNSEIASAPVKLAAGEEAHVSHGAIRKHVDSSVEDALSWRERRLIFREATLAEIAAEFNRYNRKQILIEGDRARAKQMTGVFDADRPESLIIYTSKDETLWVRAEGDDWVIQER